MRLGARIGPVAPALASACAALSVLVPVASATSDGPDAPGSPLDLRSATLRQEGRDLVLAVRTEGEWAARAMTSHPGRSLCLILRQGARRYVCVTATNAHVPALTLTAEGGGTGALPGDVDRPDRRRVVARFAANAAGLRAGRFRWTVTSTWSDSHACAQRPCGDRLPDRGEQAQRLAPPQPTGCRATGSSYRTDGPRSRRAVALTFDDGPGPYTARVLDVLRRTGVRGTFFVIGQQVSEGASLLRRALSEGHALANHSWNHANLSGGGLAQLRATNAAIRRATGYTPCLFRAPYGAVSSKLIGQARDQGMLTIQWDVDPRDWARPGADAIRARILGSTRPGSIVLMHDAGGPRGQTVAALPGVIATLRRRGYRLVTVPELLGLRPTYG